MEMTIFRNFFPYMGPFYIILPFFIWTFLLKLTIEFSIEENINSPVFPSIQQINQQAQYWNLSVDSSYHKLIPRNAWVAVRGDSKIPANLLDMMKENPLWKWNICSNECKDRFMKTVFADTSLLWAYHIVNPEVGIAKSEIWRLCILWAYGGMYIDDDAYVGQKLDVVVEPNDKFIISPESGGSWKDQCYSTEFPLSNHSLTQRFGSSANSVVLWGNNYFLNWLIFSSPFNPIMERTLERVVYLIKGEYMNKHFLLHRKHAHPGDLVLCATDFTMTLAARELVLENRTDLGLRLTKNSFAEYGGKMKAWYSDYRPDHWVKVMAKRRPKYLRAYRNTLVDDIYEGRLEGKLLQAAGSPRIYIVSNCTRRFIPDVATFHALHLDFTDVEMITTDELSYIPSGEDIASGSTSIGNHSCGRPHNDSFNSNTIIHSAVYIHRVHKAHP